MKNLLILLIVVIALFVFAAPALAQEGDELPKTAVEAVELVAVMLASAGALAGGYVGNLLMDFLKHSTPWLPKKAREAMGRGATRIIALALTEIGAVGSLALMDYAVQLDETGLWGGVVVIVTLLIAPSVSELFHRLRQYGKQQVAEA